jgi:hypothetical protein
MHNVWSQHPPCRVCKAACEAQKRSIGVYRGFLDFSVKENTYTKGAFYDVFEPVFAKQGRRALWETYRN